MQLSTVKMSEQWEIDSILELVIWRLVLALSIAMKEL